ncbi:MAG TPA: hypothetical protein VGL03_07945 [Thermoanaerobaculia bacterium]
MVILIVVIIAAAVAVWLSLRRQRTQHLRIGFVDEPRGSVEGADELVARVIHRLAGVFSEERGALEKQWDCGDQVSTEDFRLALQRYRSFFGRLLAV